MSIRKGTLVLNKKWSENEAMILAERIRLIEENINDLCLNPHAHAYSDDASQTITLAATGVPVDIDGLTSDHIAGFTFESTKQFTCLVPGHYLINYGVSFQSIGINQHLEFAIAKNGTWLNTTTSHIVAFTALNEFCVHGNGIVELLKDDIITIQVQNETSVNDIIVEHVNFSVVRIHY